MPKTSPRKVTGLELLDFGGDRAECEAQGARAQHGIGRAGGHHAGAALLSSSGGRLLMSCARRSRSRAVHQEEEECRQTFGLSPGATNPLW